MIGGPALILLYVSYEIPDIEYPVENLLLRNANVQAHVSDHPSAWAVTDAGTRIPLYTATWPGQIHFDRTEEEEYLSRQHLTLAAIRTGEIGIETNCHGWVFSGGRYWVLGKNVGTILKDNGYATVFRPRPGDIAVFRGADGAIIHTALVRSTGIGGSIVLESKWGGLGRFLHTPEHHPYATSQCTYYRSRRPNHFLREIVTDPLAD